MHLPAPDAAGGVALSGGVLNQAGVAGTKLVHRAVANADFYATLYADHVLAARGRVPVDEMARVAFAERDGGDVPGVGQFGVIGTGSAPRCGSGRRRRYTSGRFPWSAPCWC